MKYISGERRNYRLVDQINEELGINPENQTPEVEKIDGFGFLASMKERKKPDTNKSKENGSVVANSNIVLPKFRSN